MTFFEKINLHKTQNYNLNLAKAVGLNSDELEQLKENELINYRIDLLTIALSHRQRSNFDDHFKSIHSPDLEIEPHRFETNSKTNTILNKPNESTFLKSSSFSNLSTASRSTANQIEVVIHDKDNIEYSQSMKVSFSDKPDEIVKSFFRTKMLKTNHGMSSTELEFLLEDYKNTYVLNVCGSKELIFGNENTIGFYRVNFFSKFSFLKSKCLFKESFFIFRKENWYLDNFNDKIFHC